MIYRIICHRGINRRDENTYESITGVLDIKNFNSIMYGVEFDIQITHDDNIICYHDKTLERLHGDYRHVMDITYNDIKLYNLPTFENVMMKLRTNPNLIVDVELKFYEPYNQDKIKILCRKTLDICNNCNIIHQCIFTSFNDNILFELLSIDRCIKVGKLADKNYNFKNFDKLLKAGVSLLVLDKNMVLDVIDKYNVMISEVDLYVYTLFSIHDMSEDSDDTIVKKLKEKNIGLITDNVTKMTNVIISE